MTNCRALSLEFELRSTLSSMDPSVITIIGAVFAFVVGACIGSFLNVCVYRIPLNRSIVTPARIARPAARRSRGTTTCPIISWLVLRGRAACCGTRIDMRYCLVEVGMAFLFLALWLKYGADRPGGGGHLRHHGQRPDRRLPDRSRPLHHPRPLQPRRLRGGLHRLRHPSLPDGPENARCRDFPGAWPAPSSGALTLLACRVARHDAFQEGGDGHGRREVARRDLLLPRRHRRSLGSCRSPRCIGSVLGVALILWQRGAWGTRIPYGPFLGLAAILWLFGGSDVMNWYWGGVAHSWSMWNPMTRPLVNPDRYGPLIARDQIPALLFASTD